MKKKNYEKPVLTIQKFTEDVNTARLTNSGVIDYPWGSNGKDFEKEERF